MKRLPLLVVCMCLLLAGLVEGQQTPKVKGVYDPSAVKAEKVRIWEQFNQQYQNKWKVSWNPLTGTPHRINGHYLQIPDSLTQENVERVTRAELSRHRELLQIDPQALVLSKADFSPSKRPAASVGTWYVYYRQNYRGLRVYGGSVRLIIRNQKLTSMSSDYYPGIDISVDPEISESAAIQLVRQDIHARRDLEPLSSELLVYPSGKGEIIHYHLAWQVTMPPVPALMEPKEEAVQPGEERKPQERLAQWRYYVDAKTGQIVHCEDLMIYQDLSGTVTGMIRPFSPLDPQQSEPIRYITVKLTQAGMDYFADTDINGDYSFVGLGAGAADLEAQLCGPHVCVYNDETPGSEATHTAALTLPTTHSWNWSADDNSPNDIETNVYYHVTWIRDWFLRGDPFNISPEPYPMECHVRNNVRQCNASASSGGLYFYVDIPGTCEDFGLCSDIIYHEYTHRIVAKIYDDAGVDLPYWAQTGAMNEGWADYFGCSATDDPSHGEECYEGRNIDTGKYYGDPPGEARFPENWRGDSQVHWNGLIFSGAIWDARTDLGAAYADGLALRAMKQTTTSFNEYLEAVLAEDDDPGYSPDPSADANPANGTPNIDAICHAFYDLHGIYCSYCVGHTEGPVAVITSPPPNTFNLYRLGDVSITIIGTAAGSPTSPLANFVLEYGSGEEPTSWSAAGITLTGGGTSEVVDGTLGVWDIVGVPDGAYTIRLTVTDGDANTVQFSVFVNIDRLLMVGWPKEMDKHFYSSPAVGEIDPAYPGLEVVAAGSNLLYVVHADGTDAPGWPQAQPG